MDLGIFKKQQEAEHFWSLVIGKTWVEAGVWRVAADKTEIVTQGGASSWQGDNTETLITAADSTLSAAAATLDENIPEPTKVVFGLPPSWVEEGNIKKDRLELLKKLSKELELKPTGFVVIPESIVHFLKTKEGSLLNAVLVGLAEDSIDLSLVQQGKLLGTVEVAKSMSLGQDVAEGLARFSGVAQYPSRFLLYDHRAGNLDEARQNLINTDWKELNIPFLHTPKVEILPQDVGVCAVSLAGGTEVGQAKTVIYHDENEPAPEYEEEKPLEEPDEKELEEVPIEELGFMRNTDIAGKAPKKEVLKSEEVDEAAKEEAIVETELKTSSKKFPSLPKFSLPKRNWAFSPPSLPVGGGIKAFGILAFVLMALLLAGGLTYWYLPKAQVTIYVAPKTLEKTVEFRVDPGVSSVDNEKNIVPGRTVEISVSGEKTGQVSGMKVVGDRAKGRVVVYNSGGSTTLKRGTVLSGPSSLKFALDSDTPIASGSSSANPSRTQTLVTASNIGAEYNLAAGTEFSVGNFSKASLSAKNEEALSGGTSREVPAVSKEDADELGRSLERELAEQGLDSIKTTLSKEEVLVEESVSIQPTKKDFSHKPGEETSTLKLSMEAKASALIVPKDSITALVQNKIENDIPQGFSFRHDQMEVSYKRKLQETKDAKDKAKQETIFEAQVKANLLPQVNAEDVSRAIAGKYPSVAKEYLSKIPGYTRAEISFNFRFPGKLGTLPRIPKNITIEVTAER